MLQLPDLSAHHFGDNALFVLIGNVHHANLPAITHDGGAIAHPENLVSTLIVTTYNTLLK